ncbi:MAG: hypothetical protein ACLRM9_06500 [Collinsella aerofaciens]
MTYTPATRRKDHHRRRRDRPPPSCRSHAKCAEMLNGYIVTPEVNDIDSYIVNNSPRASRASWAAWPWAAQALQ